jgi:hypothetical protein
MQIESMSPASISGLLSEEEEISEADVSAKGDRDPVVGFQC